jgi:hypothetical protein
MRMLTDVERNLTASVYADLDVVGMVDFLNSSQLAVGNVQLLRRSRELHAITFGERAFHFLIHC